MRTGSTFSGLLRAAAVACAAGAPLANAQIIPDAPTYKGTDINDVDMLSGTVYLKLDDLKIGSAKDPLSHTNYVAGAWANGDTFTGYLASRPFHVYPSAPSTSPDLQGYTVIWSGQSEVFYKSGSAYGSLNQTGSTLVANANGTYTYTLRDGTIVTLDSSLVAPQWNGGINAFATSVQYPDGKVLSINNRVVSYTDPNQGPITTSRVQSVTRSDGLQIKYNYKVNAAPTSTTVNDWKTILSIIGINNAYEYCDPAADACSLARPWPTASYSSTATTKTYTDQDQRTTRYTIDNLSRVTGIKFPSSPSADNLTYFYCNNNCFTAISTPGGLDVTYYYNMIYKVVRDGQNWTYSFTPTTNQFGWSYYSSGSPSGSGPSAQLASTFAPQTGFVTPLNSLFDGINKTFFFVPTSYTGRVTSVQYNEGNTDTYSYDARGNVTGISRAAKSGFSDAPIVTSAGYDPTCNAPVKCNKPNWIKDANGNQTDFVYDTTHGGVLTATSPAVNGIRPQKRYTYSQRYAWVKNASGAYVHGGNAIWVLTQESYCKTSSYVSGACTAANDEVVTTYEYGPDSGPNNLFLRGTAVTADAQTLRICYGYDVYGNKISETRPRAGLASCP